MIKEAVKHIPKSNMAYAYDEETLHIYIQVARNDVSKVLIIIDDPFNYKVDKNGVYKWAGQTNIPKEMQFYCCTELFDYYFISVKPTNKRSKYAFLLYSNNEVYFYGCRTLKQINDSDKSLIYNLFGYFNFPYINKLDVFKAPDWSKKTIWYQIFPERFNKSLSKKGNYLPWGSIKKGINNHHFFGGDLNGIIEKIDYLKDLGITGIYFTPIFKSPSAHKYDTEDYYTIDPSFGTNEDFKRLVTICHNNNIKVMIDIVFNHCGWNFFMWQDVLKNKEKSKFYNNFYINGDPINFPLDDKKQPLKNLDGNIKFNYETFALTPFMPRLNSDNPNMRKYLLDVTVYWIKNYSIDGLRLDVSNEVSHDFWKEFRKTVKTINPDIFILGENWDDSNPWLKGDQFDAVMNYEIAYPVWQYFCSNKINGSIDSKEFIYNINNLLITYPQNVATSMFNLISSHDTPRILFRCNENPKLMKLCYLFIFSFCGSPAIYYGDEIGLSGSQDPDCRRCMIWDKKEQNLDLFYFFKKIISIKKTYLEFNEVNIKWLYYSNNIIIYQKGSIFFVINSSNKKIKIKNDIIKNDIYLNLFTNELVSISNELVLDGYSYLVFKK